MRAMNIELRIDELVLPGFTSGDPSRIGDAVERELMRLIAEQGVPSLLAQGGEVVHLDGGAFEMAPSLTGEAIGARIARAVHAGLGQRGRGWSPP